MLLHNTALSACGGAAAARRAVRLLREMRGAAVPPDAVSYAAEHFPAGIT
eukprot:gene7506-10247_t